MTKRTFHLKFSQLKPYAPEYEPPIYHKVRTVLIITGTFLILFLGLYGLCFYDGDLSRKSIIYFSGIGLIGLYGLVFMIKPNTKTFWIIFLIILPVAPFLYHIIILLLLLLFLGQVFFPIINKVLKHLFAKTEPPIETNKHE